MAVEVVVPTLRSPNLVAHDNHRHAQREHRGGEEVLHLSVPQLLDCRVIRRSLDSAVPASVVAFAIAVILAVGLVVLVVVTDQIVEREPVVTGDEVDALLAFALFVAVDFVTAKHPVCKATNRTGFAAEEVADVVAESAVPLLPRIANKTPDLIQTGRVPRLGDELGP